MSTDKKSYLEIFVGPMFSKKTSRLIDIYKQYTFCNIPVEIINHCADTRYHDTMLSSHDKVMVPCIQTDKISDVWFNNNQQSDNHLKLKNAAVILINEAQFFGDLYDCVLDMLKENKRVYIAGLDGDFSRNKFGQILDLVPMCDKITKLTALCSMCKDGTLGIFSMRLTKETQQMVIGSDNYIPVCRHCYTTNM
jgi:thymidine kinase